MTSRQLAEKLAVPANFLVVEDNPATRRMFARVLQQFGCKATEAENGNVALVKLEQTHFDGILLDIRMPECDGFEFVSRVQDKAGMPSILVVTAYADAAVYRLVETFGVLAVMRKPVTEAELTAGLLRYFEIFSVRHLPPKAHAFCPSS